ncbi:uncharacterized protein N0V96_004310 [Colletotrichum fioriniae]|uniref:uncharacterized protein n=1 Tax=Colletotrichum fioriniae TaxID=710243 RepID=UPI0032DAB8AE|nr:hypothetical protein N0V96_004310 [Colletotrichum fioriniae]
MLRAAARWITLYVSVARFGFYPKQYDEDRARELIPALNSHLEDVRRLLAKSKALSRDVQYQITPRNQRTNKALSVDSIDLAPVKQIYEVFSENVDGFWVASDDRVNADLRRRLACIVIFLRSKLDPEASVPPHIAKPFHGQTNYADIRNSGRKYIQIARKLGGLGSILWLPLDIPPSTSEPLKLAAWPIVEKTTRAYKVPTPLRTQLLEAILFFCERDSVAMRHVAVDRARSLLRKSMPYYLHATVVLFRSVLYRNDGEFTKSEAHIRDFVWRGPRPVTRRDHSLHGRLHISQMENKIKCTDDDVSLLIYEWKAELPLSTLDTEVTFRLQSTAARFFQSIGNFAAARASLEQTLSLDMTKPLRGNTRRLLVSRLADMYCEMQEYSKAAEILRPELSSSNKPELSRRAYPRLLLSSAEFNIGLGNFDAAELLLRELETQHATPIGIDTLFDQQLHMRAVLAVARIAHFRSDKNVAVTRWRYALQEIQRMHALKAEAGFTAATIHLSLAHAQLAAGDAVGASASWAAGSDILKTETCEFWLPIVPTVWLKKVTREVYEAQGWTFRMMLPGAKPDATTP